MEPQNFENVEIDVPKPLVRYLLVEVRAVFVKPTNSSLTIVGRDVAGVVVEEKIS